MLDVHIAILGTTGGKRRHLRCVPAGGAVARERLLDLHASPRERLQHSRRHSVDLGRAFLHQSPSHAEAASELVTQCGLVEEARGSRVGVDEPPVERRPLAVGSLYDDYDDLAAASGARGFVNKVRLLNIDFGHFWPRADRVTAFSRS